MKPAAWVLPALLALVVGCAAPRVPVKTEVPPGHGLVAVRVITHGPDALIRAGLTLGLQRLDVSGDAFMSSRREPRSSTAAFLAPLPPGRYRLEWMGTFKGRAPLSSLPGEFDVSADRVTDLGLIVLVFAHLKQDTGFFTTKTGRFAAAQELGERDTAAMLFALTPELRARLRADAPQQRELQANPDLNRRLLAVAKAYAGIVSSSALVPAQPVAFGRKLGQVLVWDPATGRWLAYDTGRSLSVRCVAFAGDGSLLAGLEQGVVLSNRGGEWRELARPVGNGTVEFVGEAPSGEVFTLVGDADGYRLLAARDPHAGWSVARSFPAERAQAWMAAEKLVVIEWPEDLKPAAIHVFDPATRQWSQREGPIDTQYEVLHDGGIVATSRGYRAVNMRRAGGLGSGEWRSTVMNETHRTLFVDETTAYRTSMSPSGSPPLQEIERSDDGGFTWTPVGRVLSGARLLALPKPGWFLASSLVGELSLSRDDGATWEPLTPKLE